MLMTSMMGDTARVLSCGGGGEGESGRQIQRRTQPLKGSVSEAGAVTAGCPAPVPTETQPSQPGAVTWAGSLLC